jgi:hypothetical protein
VGWVENFWKEIPWFPERTNGVGKRSRRMGRSEAAAVFISLQTAIETHGWEMSQFLHLASFRHDWFIAIRVILFITTINK